MAYMQHPAKEWTTCHFVLTRGHLLHWFRDPGELDSLDSLRLSRCQVSLLVWLQDPLCGCSCTVVLTF